MSQKLKQPTLFFGHGSPMNALAKNNFSKFLNQKGQTLAGPSAILMISAHWETPGTKVLSILKPKTIHDFSGFPKELYQIQYPALGDPELASRISTSTSREQIQASTDWGLDHGTWSVLTHLFPKANVPVLQLSLNVYLKPKQHFALAQELKKLRSEGVLILGSGNITHNLSQLDWGPDPRPMDWAVEFDEIIKKAILNRDYQILFSEDPKLKSLWQHALPSLEHYLPLLYVLGVSDEDEEVLFPYEEFQMGSLSMRAVEFSGC